MAKFLIFAPKADEEVEYYLEDPFLCQNFMKWWVKEGYLTLEELKVMTHDHQKTFVRSNINRWEKNRRAEEAKRNGVGHLGEEDLRRCQSSGVRDIKTARRGQGCLHRAPNQGEV